MMKLSIRRFIPGLIAVAPFAAVDPAAQSVNHKLDLIEGGRAKPGGAMVFTSAELNAWVRAEASTVVPRDFESRGLTWATERLCTGGFPQNPERRGYGRARLSGF
jgi:hypothetical protein